MAEPNEVFGPLFDEGQIEEATLKTLRKWLPHYLAEARSQNNYGEIAPVQSWGVVSEFDRFPEQGLPAVIVMCPGTRAEPEQVGDHYEATYSLSVAVEVAAAHGQVARRVAQIYGAAVLGAIMHHRSLGTGDLRVTSWHGESNATIGIEQRRTRIAVEQTFSVLCTQVLSIMAGPSGEPPPDEWPEITDIDVEVGPYGESS